MKKYLLAWDGSENSRRAALFLLDLVGNSKEYEITVIHVVNIRKEIYNHSVFKDIGEIEQIVREDGHRKIDEVAAIFNNHGITVNKVVLEGDPGNEISEFVEQGDFDHIIMGSRGLGNIKGLVLGSVSHKVLHFARRAVTLIK